MSLGYLSQIELGKNSASIETLYRICLALGMKMSELFQSVQRCYLTMRGSSDSHGPGATWAVFVL